MIDLVERGGAIVFGLACVILGSSLAGSAVSSGLQGTDASTQAFALVAVGCIGMVGMGVSIIADALKPDDAELNSP